MNNVERGGNSRLPPQTGSLVPGFQIPVMLDTVNACIFEKTTTKNKTQIQTYKRQKSPPKKPMWSSVFNTKRKLFGCLKKNNS